MVVGNLNTPKYQRKQPLGPLFNKSLLVCLIVTAGEDRTNLFIKFSQVLFIVWSTRKEQFFYIF